MDKVLKILKNLSNLKIFFWSMLWLMVITVIGTVEQKNIGLFAAQEKYFASMYFTAFGIPFPGGGLIIIILSIGLISQLIFKTPFRSFKKSGITATHIGALILLCGSFITYLNAIEGSLVLKEAETKNTVLDYRNFDLAFIDETDPTKSKSIDLNTLGSYLSNSSKKIFEDVILEKINIFDSCILVPNEKPLENEVGFAKLFSFREASGIDAANTSEQCVEFSLKEKNQIQNYRVFLNMPKEQSFNTLSAKGIVRVRNREIPLPFSVKLIDFEKKFHQGTMISKSFKSLVEITDGDLKFNRLIEMNSPLRYKGYTFYQSSFSENSEGEMSELAVVKNSAQWFPYISSIILCAGILWHLILISRQKRKNENDL